MFKNQPKNTANNYQQCLCWNQVLVWKEPVQASRQRDADHAANRGAGRDEYVDDAHGTVFV